MARRFITRCSSAWDRSASSVALSIRLCFASLLFTGGLAVAGRLQVHPQMQMLAAQQASIQGSAPQASRSSEADAKVVSEGDRAFFENRAKPMFCNHCIFCHNDQLANGGLSLEHWRTMLQGGRLGPALVPGSPDRSLIVHAMRRDGTAAPMMPPGPRLADQDIETIAEWIRRGALWGKDPIACEERGAAKS